MDFNIFKFGAFIVLIVLYLTIRKFFGKVADFTENMGNTPDHEEELNLLKSKVAVLEEQLKYKP